MWRTASSGPRRSTSTVAAPLAIARLAHGSSTHQIADLLHLSRETVRNHIRGVLQALEVHSRVEAVATARAEGLIAD